MRQQVQQQAPQSSENPRNLDRLIRDCMVVLVPALVLYCFALLRLQLLEDGDSGWHIAAGKWMIAQRDVPHVDILSYSAKGQPWVAHEWLADVFMGAAHSLAGWTGVLIFYGLVVAAFMGVVASYLRRWLEPGAVGAIVIALMLALYPFLLARPHVTAWPVMAAWVVLLLRAREEDRLPPWWSVLLITLWANLHGSFVLGIGLIGPFAAEALFAATPARRLAVFRQWTLFGIAAVLAAAATPYGIHGLLFPFQLNAMPTLALIDEWKPTSFAEIKPFELVFLAGLGACLWLGVKVPAWRLAIILLLLHMALAHIRHQTVFVIITALILAAPLAAALGNDRPRFALRPALSGTRRDLAPLVAILLLLALGTTGWRLANPARPLDSATVPTTAVEQLPAELKAKRVFNDYSFGGSLALIGIPVYIDGRADMYGDAAMRHYRDLVTAPSAAKWQPVVDRWGIEWTILSPQTPLTRFLDSQPGWRRVYADDWAVIHVRENGPPVTASER